MNRRKKRNGLQRALAMVLCAIIVLTNQAPMVALAEGNIKAEQQVATPTPETPTPETPAPETPAPETPAPETPAPETPAPETPAPETPTPETPAPEIVPEEITTVVYVDPSKGESQDGKTADTPVNSLEQAITLAMELRTKTEREITITVLSPVVVREQEIISFDGQGIRLVNGGENTTMFQIKGGKLTLSNMTLTANETKEQAVIQIAGGTLGIGEGLIVESPILYDYEQAGEELPMIEVAKELAKDSIYEIRIIGADATNGAAGIKATYEDGEAGMALQNHFNIQDADVALWKLTTSIANEEADRQKEEKTSKTIYFLNAQISFLAATSPVYWNSNKADVKDSDGTVKIKGGSDKNDGSSQEYPILTWAAAKEKAIANKSYTVIYMSNTIMENATDAGINSTDTIDGATSVAGQNIVLQQWETTPEDAFLVSEGTELTLQNITLQRAEGVGKSTIVRIAKGKLNIGTGVVIHGQIQEELSAVDVSKVSPINVTAPIADGVKYEVYFSDINDNLTNLYANVIQPIPDTEAGWNLKEHFILSASNTNAGWSLRYDMDDGTDADGEHPNTLELYQNYEYQSIYLDGVRGNDKYFGGTCKFPVKTFAKAKQLLKEKMSGNGVIFVCGPVTVSDTQTWSLPKSEYPNAKVLLCTHVLNGTAHVADHKDPANPDGADQGIATNMVKVTGTGNLTTDNITLEYDAVQSYSSSIIEVENGGTYTMNEGTILTGGMNVTPGYGIRANGAAEITLNGDAATTGIRNRSRGIYFTGMNKETSKLTMAGASISGMSSPGSGIASGAGMYLSSVTMTMTGGEIKTNTIGGNGDSTSSNRYGGGIYAGNSQLDISGGSITGNSTLSYNSHSAFNGYGGGIALSSSTLNISGNAQIANNTATTRGGGIYATGTSNISMTGGTIAENQVRWGYSSYIMGGGIYTEGATALTITKGTIEKNTSQYDGGGVYIHASGSEVTSTFSSEATITANVATEHYGGGVYTAGGSKVVFDGASITDNQATSGGGIYISGGNLTTIVKNDTKIQANTATSVGGGILSNGPMDVTSATISGNKASDGAGIYISGSYTNRILGGTISGNTATNNGGGVYASNTSRGFTMKDGTITGNTAASGPSLYTTGVTNLLGGSIPDAVEKDIVVNVSAGSGYATRLDLKGITLSDQKDKMYLTTASSKLTLLGGVKDNDDATKGTLKVALNPDVFRTGSIVVVPSGNITLEGTTYNDTDVSEKSLYFTEGTIPDKTQLGGFNKNILLVGEGVYLDGTKGKDTSNGTSPTTAVQTFAKAKELLQKYVAEHEADTADADGFLPYIYICGEVPITTAETWELDATLAANNPGKNDVEPQVLRFASYYGKMVSVADTGVFTVEKLLMNGNHEAVDGAPNNVRAMIDVVTGGKVTLLEGSKILSNYTDAIVMRGGTLHMSGTGTGAEVGRGRSNGIYASAGAEITLSEKAHVDNPALATGNSSGAVSLTGKGTTMTMGDNTYVSAVGAIGITVSNQAVLAMKGDARIQDVGTGIYSSAEVTMEGTSHITGFAMAISQTSTAQTMMKGESHITGAGSSSGTGVMISSATEGNTLTLQGDAKIEAVSVGVHFSQYTSKAKVSLANRAKIETCTNGIKNYVSAGRENQLILTDMAHISDCEGAGVYSEACSTGSADGKLSVTMGGDSYIGGTGAVPGNGYGIQNIGTGIDLTMTENAAIQYNASDGVYTLGSTNDSQQGMIHLSNAAKIASNGGTGINSQENTASNITTYGSAITLADTAAITDNGKIGVYLQKRSSLTLGDGTAVSGNKAGDETKGAGIYAAGKLNLSGGATVDKEIYLQDAKNPISLTSAIAEGNTFHVGYHENFVGQTVVMPAGSIADATTYYDNFAATTHVPEEKHMIKKSPNIVVQGENNIYLAGDGTTTNVAAGDDANNGRGLGSPVRTFQRAKELLKEMETGANIYICNYPVTIKSNDTNWSFATGGTVTNKNDETWMPKIIRHEKYTGVMIQLGGTAMEMNHLTLDGNGEKVTANDAMIKWTYAVENPVTIQNCTFENAKSSGAGGAIYQYYGTKLKISDSIFRNNTASFGGSIAQSDSRADLEVTGCTFTENTASNEGGAIYNAGGKISIADSQMTRNKASIGSAITYKSGEGLTVKDTSITKNEATVYGAVTFSGGTNRIIGGEISENQSTNPTYGYGGAISNTGGTLTLDGVAISKNTGVTTSSSKGLGIYNSTTLTMEEGVVEGNTKAAGGNVQGAGIYNSGTFILKGGSIKGNGAGESTITGAGIYNAGTLTVQGGSIEGNGAGAANVTGGGVYNVGTFKMSGGSITGNIGTTGAAIAHMGGKTTMEGGLISGNQAPIVARAARNMEKSPVYVNATNFIIQGGASTISDQIYLSHPNYPITLSGSIYQRGRLYNIALADTFIKGNTVVQPDGEVIQNATQYHKYFAAQRNGCVLEKAQPNLILKQCIFLDSKTGKDTNSGATPAEAVATFAEAKRKAGENALILVSGPVYVNGTENWELPATTSLCRYVGFPVSEVKYDGYFGPMIVTDAGDDLTIGQMSIYGRRDIDGVYNAEAVCKVGADSQVTTNNTTIMRNDNSKKTDTLSAQGGAFHVEKGGTLNINGGTIKDNTALDGQAIYMDGTLNLAGSPLIKGDVFLTGKDTDAATSSYVVPATSYIPAPDTLLELNIENPYNSRQVVVYPAGTIPTEKEKAYYQLDANVRALFRFENRTDVDNVLELQQKGFVYVDGAQDGHGDDAHDGTTPERAVKTLKKAYQLLAKEKVGGLISIVGTVTIDQTTSMMNTVTGDTYVAEYKDGSGTVDAGGAVYLRRYAQPTDWKSLSGYDVPSHKGSVLNIVDGGALTLGSVTVDGHSEALTGLPALAAKGVEANAALVEVQTGGTFTCEQYCQLINNNNVATDGKGGALYIHGGTASLKRTNILQVAAKKGSAVYQDGIFNIAFQPKIEGSVYLTGTGTETSPDSSRSIGVLFNGFRPQSGKLDVEVEDPYKGRTIATYPEGGEPSVNERSIYQLSDEINDRYIIGNRTTATNVLELQYRPAVYVDGAVGSDDNTGLAPDTSVKTLKKAYTLLKKMGGGVLYVVDTITLTTETSITGTSYTAGADKIEIIGTPTEIRRYAQPDKWAEYPDFTHASNLNPLIRVAGSTTLQVENLTIDGHKNARTDKGLSPSMIVTGTTQAKGPAILVDIAGNLNLNPGTIIKDNANTATTTALAGGAVGNFGTTVFTDTVLQDNEAVKGAGVYQHGSFTIYGADGLGKQEIYLATNNIGTETDPVWGEGYVIHVQEKLKDTVALNINVDHPVRGRNITVFDTKDAFIDDVSNEIPRFILGNTVPNTLSFVKSETETNTLELQNYDVTYYGNGNTEGIPPVDGHSPYTKGAQVTVLGNMDLTKANAHFLGWNTKADGSGMHYNPLNQFEITENTDLYAMWLKYEKVAEEATPEDNVLRPGEELTYTIKTTMPEAIGNVKIEDRIPENTTYVEGSASGNLTPTFADGKLTWNLGTVHGDQEFNATFKVIVNKDTAEGTDITNTAVVTIAEKDYHTNTTTNTVGKTFSVLYDANGATSGDVPVDTGNYIEGEEPVVQAEGTLARTNAVFFGWNTKADGTGDHYQTNETVKNLKDKVTLYAMWMVAEKNSEEETPGGTLKPGEKLTYTIHVEVPEAKNAVIEDIIPIGTTYVANSANEGGIYDEATNTVTWKLTTTKKTIKDFQFAVTVDVAAVEGVQITNQAKVTIEGQEYTSNEKIDSVGVTYHVIYDGNTNESGTVPIDGAIYEKNEAAIVQGSNDLMKADYVCVGWNTKADGSGDAYVKDNKMTVHADTTLYAMWMKATKISTEGENNNILKPGEELTYTIDVVIPQKTEKLVVVDVIPKGTTYLDGSANENGVYEDGKLTWTLENSEGGSEKQFVFTVIVDRLVTEGTGISNTAEIVIGDNKYHTTTAENKVGKTHTVTYDGSNSDAGQAPIDQRFYAETDYAAVLGNVGAQIARAIGEPMSKKNAVFAGWNTRKDGTGIHYEENDTILMTGDVTLYAMWNQAYKDSMTVDGKPILPGSTMEYKITVKAADNTKQITVLDKIPEGTTYVEGSASNQGVFADNQITWNFTEIPVGTVLELTFRVLVADLKPNTEIFNQAKITIITNQDITMEQVTNKVTDQVAEYTPSDTKPTPPDTKPTPPDTKPTPLNTGGKETVKTGDKTNTRGLAGVLGMATVVIFGIWMMKGIKRRKKTDN